MIEEALWIDGILAQWLAALGTILVAVVAIFQDRIRAYLRSPKLECEIETKPPDCHRTMTRLTIPGPRGNLRQEFYSYYYRSKIWNKGKTSAEKVEVVLTDVFRKDGEDYKRIEAFSLDNLVWSVPGEAGERHIYCDYISPQTYKYCNLGHIHDPGHRDAIPGESNPGLLVKEDVTIFCFDVYFRSNILYYLIPPSIYKVVVKVGCMNAKTITREYELIVTGKWSEDETKMLSEGLSIKEVK